MSNHYTADGSISIYDDGAEYTGPVVSVDHRQPAEHRSERDQHLDDMQALLDWLRARPDVPLGRQALRTTFYVRQDDDAAGFAELAAIADAAGTQVTDMWKQPVGSNETHHYVKVTFGGAGYEAIYITRDWMAGYDARASYQGNISTDSADGGAS